VAEEVLLVREVRLQDAAPEEGEGHLRPAGHRREAGDVAEEEDEGMDDVKASFEAKAAAR
jgi:hypothetical protein